MTIRDSLPDNYREDPNVARETLRRLEATRDALKPAPSWATPGVLAKALDPNTVQTTALDVIDAAIVEAYNTPDARLIISMPPQEGKSERTTKVGSLWALIKNPELRIGIVSYSAPLAATFSRDIRNWINEHAGVDGTLDLRLRLSPDSRAINRWQLDGHRGGVYAVGVGGTLTGRPLDALVIDDPFKDNEDADSPAYRKRVWEWWQSVAATRLAPGAPVILIMTRWHEDDLAGKLLAAEDAHLWKVINIPARADHDPEQGQTDPLGREPGEYMVSARGARNWPAIELRSGSRTWSALYQGNPTPDKGNIWLRHWWVRYDAPMWSIAPDRKTYHIEGVDSLTMTWDMAFKDTKGSDFVVGQLWAKRGPNAYLIDQVRDRMDFTATLAAFKAFVEKWPQAGMKLVEDKANGPAVISSLRKEIPGIVAYDPGQNSKLARASAAAPFIEAGNAKLPSKEIALFPVDEYLDETAAFPNDSHDDQVDASSQYFARIFLEGAGFDEWLKSLEQSAIENSNAIIVAAAEQESELDPLEAARLADFHSSYR